MHDGRAARRVQPRASWRRRVIGLVGLGLVNVGVLGTDLFLLSQRNVTSPVTLGAALRQFRAAQTAGAVTAAPTASPASAAVGPGSAAHAPVASTAAAPPVATTTARGARSVPTSTSSTSSTSSPAVPFTLPAEGVYSYKTSGGEKVNILDSSHSYPATTYATVRHQGGCVWQMENDVIQEHTDRRHLCSGQGQFTEIDQSRTITFFGQTDGMTYTCTPQLLLIKVGEAAGTARDGVCADAKGNAAHLHAVDLGTQQAVVGGVTVTVVHSVLDGQLTGRAVGTSHDELLTLASTGMTVSWIRSVDTVADAAFGAKAHYTEHASFQLLSLTPQT